MWAPMEDVGVWVFNGECFGMYLIENAECVVDFGVFYMILVFDGEF